MLRHRSIASQGSRSALSREIVSTFETRHRTSLSVRSASLPEVQSSFDLAWNSAYPGDSEDRRSETPEWATLRSAVRVFAQRGAMGSRVDRWWVNPLDIAALEQELCDAGWSRRPAAVSIDGGFRRMANGSRQVQIWPCDGGACFVDHVEIMQPRAALGGPQLSTSGRVFDRPFDRLEANGVVGLDSEDALDWLADARFASAAEWLSAAERLAAGGRQDAARRALRCAEVVAGLERPPRDLARRRQTLAERSGLGDTPSTAVAEQAAALRHLGFGEIDPVDPKFFREFGVGDPVGVFMVRDGVLWSCRLRLREEHGELKCRIERTGAVTEADGAVDESSAELFPRTVRLSVDTGAGAWAGVAKWLRLTQSSSNRYQCELRGAGDTRSARPSRTTRGKR